MAKVVARGAALFPVCISGKSCLWFCHRTHAYEKMAVQEARDSRGLYILYHVNVAQNVQGNLVRVDDVSEKHQKIKIVNEGAC